jgi:hypothetical protein
VYQDKGPVYQQPFTGRVNPNRNCYFNTSTPGQLGPTFPPGMVSWDQWQQASERLPGRSTLFTGFIMGLCYPSFTDKLSAGFMMGLC